MDKRKHSSSSLNDKIALLLASGLSNMWFFWFCLMLDLAELKPVIQAHDVITWCTYLSQTVIQLLALPLLATQQKILDSNHKETVKHIKKIHDNHKDTVLQIKELHSKIGANND